MKKNGMMNIIIDNITWKTIFKVCFKVLTDNSIIWFQYRLLNRILCVKKYLHTLNISNTDICRLCSNDSETILHLFVHCPKSKELWYSLKSWISGELGIVLNLTTETILLGYLYSDSNFEPINHFLLVTKNFIFHSALNKKPLTFGVLKLRLKTTFLEQELVAKNYFQEDKYFLI